MAKYRKPTHNELIDAFNMLCDRVALAQDISYDRAELNRVLDIMGRFSRSRHTHNGRLDEKTVLQNNLHVFWNDIMQNPQLGTKISSIRPVGVPLTAAEKAAEEADE